MNLLIRIFIQLKAKCLLSILDPLVVYIASHRGYGGGHSNSFNCNIPLLREPLNPNQVFISTVYINDCVHSY